MRQFFFEAHPVALLSLLAATTVVVAGAGHRRWPGAPVALAWALGPALLNPLVWYAGSPLFGWRMGGLGGWLYLWLFLPLNGLAIGMASVPLLTALLGRERNGLRLFGPGLIFQAVALFVWLAIASQVHMYVGNVSG